MTSASSTEIVLHVWPALWDLPSINSECLASIIYAQLAIPGKFVIEESTEPDLSPNGQLPYLTHNLACAASFPSIVKYINSLLQSDDADEADQAPEESTNLSLLLSPTEKAQQTAWLAYVSANLGDLVACNLYTLRHNYFDFTRPALASLFNIPQIYYVPDRLRLCYKPRLEAAGLWNVHTEEAEEEKKRKQQQPTAQKRLHEHETVFEAFGREKVLDKGRRAFDILSGLLGDRLFFFGDRPTSLDSLVAAHILLITFPPAPNDLLRTLLSSSYPTLHSHARRMYASAISPPASLSPESSVYSSAFELPRHPHRKASPPLAVRKAPRPSAIQLLSSVLPWTPVPSSKNARAKKSEEDKQYDRMRWAWYGLSALGVVGWVWVTGTRIRIVDKDDHSQAAEEDLVEDVDFEEDEEDSL